MQAEDLIIRIENMKVYAYHGVLNVEKINGQFFIFSIEMKINIDLNNLNDDIENTINYKEIYENVIDFNKYNRFNLIETLAYNIAKMLLNLYKHIDKIRIQVKKPNAPIDGNFDYISAQLVVGR